MKQDKDAMEAARIDRAISRPPDDAKGPSQEAAREVVAKLSNLPNYYTPGADGGNFHALDPEKAMPIVLAALRAERERTLREVVAVAQKASDSGRSAYFVLVALRDALRALSESGVPPLTRQTAEDWRRWSGMKGPCPVCGNEARGQGGYLTCECPVPQKSGAPPEEGR